MKILGYEFFEGNNIEAIESKSDNRTITKSVLERQKFRMREDLRSLELAIMDRQNISNWNRELIHKVYRKVMQDSHISSQWTTRLLKTLKKDFSVVPDGNFEPNTELTRMLQTGWFYKFMRMALESRAWGFSLIEFGLWDSDAQTFKPYRYSTGIRKGRIHEDIIVVERDNTKPEFGVVTMTEGESHGTDFLDPKWEKTTMFIGGSDDGWLYEAAKPYLIKDNTVKNWSEFAELFGMDVRVVKSEAQGEDLTKLKNNMKTAVGGGSIVLDPDESMEYIGTGRSDAFEVFKQLVDYQDSTLSKLIFGQDVVSNNTGRVVGQVGENVSDMYGDADARWLKFIIEDQLFPLLEKNGVTGISKMKFIWGMKENVGLSDRADIDLKLTQMGFAHPVDYINETYDVNVTEDEAAKQTQNAEQLRQLYDGARTISN